MEFSSWFTSIYILAVTVGFARGSWCDGVWVARYLLGVSTCEEKEEEQNWAEGEADL